MTGKKLIYLAWGFYGTAMVMPWTAKPFGGWLGGWFWNVLDLFPFMHLLAHPQFGIREALVVSAPLANLAMLGSPLVAFPRGDAISRKYRVVYWAAAAMAAVAVGRRLVGIEHYQLPASWLYYLGNAFWLASVIILAVGVQMLGEIGRMTPDRSSR